MKEVFNMLVQLLLGILALIIVVAGVVCISEEISDYMNNENWQEANEFDVVFK